MKRVLMGVVTIAVLLTNCQRGTAETAGSEENDKVKIVIGEASFEYEGKSENPVPEVRFGEKFDIEVRWKEGTREGQSLSFSDFRVARIDFDKAALPPEDGKSVLWKPLGEATLKEAGDGEYELSKGAVRFSKPAEGDTSAGTFILMAPMGIDEILGEPGTEDRARGTVLIFFDVELKTAGGETVYFDPPWAGKRGRG